MKTSNGKIVVGVLLVLAGFFFMADNFMIFPFYFRHYFFHWSAIVTLVGIIIVATASNKGFGLFLLLVGGFFMAARIVPFSAGIILHNWWPILLILAGLWIMLKHNFSRNNHTDGKYFSNNDSIDPDDKVDIVNFFGGGDKKIVSKNFKGGSVVSIFGGGDLDMRDANLAPGINTLELVTIFGGTDLIVPANWKVSIRVTSVFGGFDDQRKRVETENIEHDRTLIIKGVILFGGGDIKN